jgi:hypothetical protein
VLLQNPIFKEGGEDDEEVILDSIAGRILDDAIYHLCADPCKGWNADVGKGRGFGDT